MSVHVFGVRHHGPGSARSLCAALAALAPDAILVEGPPEAGELLPLAAESGMEPPVAILAYVPEEPQRAAFFPFAAFSPEWQAIRYGLAQGVPLRFMDLPQRHWLALLEPAPVAPAEPEPEEGATPPAPADPLDALARAAGYEDGERWWERLVEERAGDREVFAAVLELMAAARAAREGERDGDERPEAPRKGGGTAGAELEALREAAMRTAIRAAQAEGRERIAVVCGAWHAPALVELAPARADRDLLKGLPRVAVEVTWVPWTYGHLSRASGYGAGVASPGWYEHLWTTPTHTGARWLGCVAHLLRQEDLDASSAQVIDAVRLADALAAMRGRSRPGLAELNQAALAVLCFGNPLPLEVIHRRLIVGDRLGRVPPGTPAVPLQQDLAALQRRLRLPPQAEPRQWDLDLRRANDLARSALLHRLGLLGIPWGRLERAVGAKGTFHELWTLKWEPAFAVAVIEAAVWGNTVAEATAALARQRAQGAHDLAALTTLLDQVLLADLPEVLGPLLAQLQAEAALSGDVARLMDALPPLARGLRYGTVRQTAGTGTLDAEAIGTVVDGLVARICIGLGLACASLDDEAAAAMLGRLEGVHAALAIVERPALDAGWQRALAGLADQQGVHGLLAGRAVRLLSDRGALAAEEVTRRLALALSRGAAAEQAAAWLEGLLRGSGLLLLHDQTLWAILDSWLAELSAEAFTAVLPLLRRTFAAFPAPERRRMGERAARGASGAPVRLGSAKIDDARAGAVLPLLGRLLGLATDEDQEEAADA